jgi:small-conductance mechanosensitive channel
MDNKWQELRDFFHTHIGSGELRTFFILVAAGLAAALLARILCQRAFLKRTGKNGTLPVQDLLNLAQFTLPLVIFLYFFNIALDVFKEMPSWLWSWKKNLIPALCFLIIVSTIWRGIDLVIKGVFSRFFNTGESVDDHLCLAISRFIKAGFLLFTGLFVLNNLGFQVLSLITGLSFLGAAVALATQSTIGNIIGGFEIMADRLFKQGDRISFTDYDGFVVHRGLRSVVLQSIYGEFINIPNKDLVDKQIRNYTRDKDSSGKIVRQHRLKFEVGLVYETSADQIRQATELLKEICLDLEPKGNPQIVFRRLGAFSLDLEAIFWASYATETDLNMLLNRVNLAIKERFDREGLSFAFPTQTIHLAGGEGVR